MLSRRTKRNTLVDCCSTLLHTATHCYTLLHTATHCNTLQHTATHCNSSQHTATHCNTLQHRFLVHALEAYQTEHRCKPWQVAPPTIELNDTCKTMFPLFLGCVCICVFGVFFSCVFSTYTCKQWQVAPPIIELNGTGKETFSFFFGCVCVLAVFFVLV